MQASRLFILYALAGFMVMTVSAQNAGKDLLQQQFTAYGQKTLQEKIYLHSDKDVYLAGEICWFKLYYVDAFFHKPLALSKVAYVEVLDKDNSPVLQAKVALKEGSGNGSFFLPSSLVSGNYTLRAYTNWMKNFGPDYFFGKKLTIINSRKIYEGTAPVQKDLYDIQFFPEGGNLVSGIKSKLAFRVVGQNGKGLDCMGAVINDKNDTVVRFSPLKFGMGSFELTPEAGRSYKAVIMFPGGKKALQDLPLAYSTGYVMHLAEAGNNQLKITVKTSAGNSSSVVYLFAHTRGSVKSSASGTFRDGNAEFLVDKNKLGDGISHFTVFNTARDPVCERLYFKYPGQRMEVEMTTDKLEYELRKKINIQLKTTDKSGTPVPANMSIAVYRIDSLQQLDGMDITNYLWLSSDLAGNIESPEYYFNSKETATEEAMDNLMLTQGWRRFRWEDILQNNNPSFEFLPEYVGHIVNGKITKTSTGLPAKDIGVYLSVPSVRTQFRPAFSDANGHLKFDLNNFYNQGEIIVQTNNQQDSGYTIEISNPFFEKYADSHLPPFSLSGVNTGALQRHHLGMQVQNAYIGNRLKQFRFPHIDTTAFYFKPDFTYLLDNYVRFTTLDEVLREYVPAVSVTMKRGKYHLPVMDELSRLYFEMDPLVLLDGVPVFDFDKFMAYDPLKIRKLEIVSRMHYLGNMFFEGVVNFVTYKGNLEEYELDPHATVIDYEGLQMQREFFSPVYETQRQVDSKLPDFRNLLFWSPEIKTSANGKQDISFYSSDLPGNFAAVIQGLTPDGKTGSKTLLFEIKDPARGGVTQK